MCYNIQLSRAQILAICTALEQCPPQIAPQHTAVDAFELQNLKTMFEDTLQEPEGSNVLHGFTV